MQVPRHTYLPLLIPEIKENMVELALDDSILSGLDEKDWWFEEEPPRAEEGEVFAGQGVCKWYVCFILFSSLLLLPLSLRDAFGGGTELIVGIGQ